MAASVNNIAAAFSSSASRASAPSSPSFSSSPSPPATATFSSTPSSSFGLAISASWNPHSSLPRSRFSSLLSFYGPPGPRPRPSPSLPPSPSHLISIGNSLPFSTLSYLSDRTVLTTSSLELARGTKAVILGVPAAFAPRPWRPLKLTAEELVTRAGEMKGRGAAVVACVSANDVFVMRAWGESIGAAGVMMLSDPGAGMARAMGLAADFGAAAEGFGLRSQNYCLVADDGIVKAVFREVDGVGFDDVVRAI